MSFTKLEPPKRAEEALKLTAAVVVNRFGVVTIDLVFAGALKKLLGGAAYDISLGSGDDAGKILMEACSKGAFAAAKAGGPGGNAAGYRLKMPVIDGAPDFHTTREPCRILEATAGRALFELPLAAWTKRQELPPAPPPAPPADAARAPTPPPPPAADPPSKPAPGKLDVVTYLKNKGRDVERLAGGLYVDANPASLSQCLRMVNSYRQEADLEPLTLDKVW